MEGILLFRIRKHVIGGQGIYITRFTFEFEFLLLQLVKVFAGLFVKIAPKPINSCRPKAFLNWIIVDEEFKKVTSSFHMGAVQVPVIDGSNGAVAITLTGPDQMTVRRNGWLYVYVSNESNQDVYFDDLVINHQRGPVVEQNNYYAFGLEIPGLASKAVGFGTSPENRKKYNGIEFNADLGLNVDEAFYRNLDPQTGRFWQVDPKVDAGYENQSPYGSMYNNPVRNSDPLGDEGEEANNCCKTSGEILKSGMALALTTEGIGGGPLDPVADVAAGGLVVGTVIYAGFTALNEIPVSKSTGPGIVIGSPLMMGTDSYSPKELLPLPHQLHQHPLIQLNILDLVVLKLPAHLMENKILKAALQKKRFEMQRSKMEFQEVNSQTKLLSQTRLKETKPD